MAGGVALQDVKKDRSANEGAALDPWIEASMFAAWKRFCHVSALLCSFLVCSMPVLCTLPSVTHMVNLCM